MIMQLSGQMTALKKVVFDKSFWQTGVLPLALFDGQTKTKRKSYMISKQVREHKGNPVTSDTHTQMKIFRL